MKKNAALQLHKNKRVYVVSSSYCYTYLPVCERSTCLSLCIIHQFIRFLIRATIIEISTQPNRFHVLYIYMCMYKCVQENDYYEGISAHCAVMCTCTSICRGEVNWQ